MHNNIYELKKIKRTYHLKWRVILISWGSKSIHKHLNNYVTVLFAGMQVCLVPPKDTSNQICCIGSGNVICSYCVD